MGSDGGDQLDRLQIFALIIGAGKAQTRTDLLEMDFLLHSLTGAGKAALVPAFIV